MFGRSVAVLERGCVRGNDAVLHFSVPIPKCICVDAIRSPVPNHL